MNTKLQLASHFVRIAEKLYICLTHHGIYYSIAAAPSHILLTIASVSLSRLMHTELHWLDVPEWVKLSVLMCDASTTKILSIWTTTARQFLTLF